MLWRHASQRSGKATSEVCIKTRRVTGDSCETDEVFGNVVTNDISKGYPQKQKQKNNSNNDNNFSIERTEDFRSYSLPVSSKANANVVAPTADSVSKPAHGAPGIVLVSAPFKDSTCDRLHSLLL